MIFILSGHTHDDEPHITEDVFFSCLMYNEFLFHFPMDLLVMELMKHEVLHESSSEIVAKLTPTRGIIDSLHYVMYRIGKKENGLQIFYQCLKETQDRAPEYRYAVETLKMECEFSALKNFRE